MITLMVASSICVIILVVIFVILVKIGAVPSGASGQVIINLAFINANHISEGEEREGQDRAQGHSEKEGGNFAQTHLGQDQSFKV